MRQPALVVILAASWLFFLLYAFMPVREAASVFIATSSHPRSSHGSSNEDATVLLGNNNIYSLNTDGEMQTSATSNPNRPAVTSSSPLEISVAGQISTGEEGTSLATTSAPVTATVNASASPSLSPPASTNISSKLPFGVNLWADIGKSYGVSEASRGVAYQLLAAKVPLVINSFSSVDRRVFSAGTEELMMSLLKDEHSFASPYYFNLFVSFPSLAAEHHSKYHRVHFRNHSNLAMYWWELEIPPNDVETALNIFDEILTVAKFVADSFRTLKHRTPIHHLGCIALPELFQESAVIPLEAARSRFKLSTSDYVFLFVWDYYSTEERKNPMSIVRAFIEAFETQKEKQEAVLILKGLHSTNGRARALLSPADSSYRIQVIEDELSDTEMEYLYTATNCYVSLHRSEGFGNGIAHAMGKGKPVIFTNYSAPVEFANETNAYPVKWRYIDVGAMSSTVGFPPNAKWADADVSDAAKQMREVGFEFCF